MYVLETGGWIRSGEQVCDYYSPKLNRILGLCSTLGCLNFRLFLIFILLSWLFLFIADSTSCPIANPHFTERHLSDRNSSFVLLLRNQQNKYKRLSPKATTARYGTVPVRGFKKCTQLEIKFIEMAKGRPWSLDYHINKWFLVFYFFVADA